MQAHVANLFRRAAVHAKNGGFAGDMLKFDAASQTGVAGRELYRRAIYVCHEECDSEMAQRFEKALSELPELPEDQVSVVINGKQLSPAEVEVLNNALTIYKESIERPSKNCEELSSLADVHRIQDAIKGN